MPIKPYTGALEDEELRRLARYLVQVAPLPNLRVLEKRGWRRGLGSGDRYSVETLGLRLSP